MPDPEVVGFGWELSLGPVVRTLEIESLSGPVFTGIYLEEDVTAPRPAVIGIQGELLSGPVFSGLYLEEAQQPSIIGFVIEVDN